MADEFIPELTLNPNSPLAGQGQAAPAPAPAAASTPPSEAHLPESDLDEAKLSPAQRKAVEDFARTIDITDSNVVLQYGAAAQKNVSEFSENTLQQIRTKDLGQIGETLADLVRQLQEFDPEEEKKGFAGFFRRKKNQLAALKAGYAKASANVDQIVENLQAHQITLMKDVANLDGLILNMATRIKTNLGGTSITTVEEALDVLTRTGVINSPDYWASKYTALAWLDVLLISAANALTE